MVQGALPPPPRHHQAPPLPYLLQADDPQVGALVPQGVERVGAGADRVPSAPRLLKHGAVLWRQRGGGGTGA